jgi:hypothetical protein
VDKLQKLQDLVVPKEMTLLNIIHAKTEFVCAAENEFYASFDVELHASKRIFIRGIPIACKQYQKE